MILNKNKTTSMTAHFKKEGVKMYKNKKPLTIAAF